MNPWIFILILICVVALLCIGLALLVHWLSDVVLRKYFEAKGKFISKIGGEE